MLKLPITNHNYFSQFLILLITTLISTGIFLILGSLFSVLAFKVDLNNMNDLQADNVIAALKVSQIFSAIGFFIIPPLFYAKLYYRNPLSHLGIYKLPNAKIFLLCIALFIIITPMLNYLVVFNESIDLPDSLSTIETIFKNYELEAEKLTKVFLQMNTFSDFILVFFIVAIIPAFGEELFFRGALQQLFIKWFKNSHIAIWVTAFLFSALHFQFYGFLPRMFLGALLGYFFYWSQSLWVSILFHLFNNGSLVILEYFSETSYFDQKQELDTIDFYMLPFSFILAVVIFYIIQKQTKRSDI